MDPLAQDQTQNKSCKQPSPKLTGDQHNLKNQNNHSVHLTLDSQANLDFQQAIRNLDVLHASEDDRRHVSNLRDRALFLAEAERQFFCQKLKTKHLVNADKGIKYFHELIRNRQRGLAIPTVCAMDGTPSTSLDQVGENFVTFFSDLFGTARDRQHSVSSLIANGPMVSTAHATTLASRLTHVPCCLLLPSLGGCSVLSLWFTHHAFFYLYRVLLSCSGFGIYHVADVLLVFLDFPFSWTGATVLDLQWQMGWDRGDAREGNGFESRDLADSAKAIGSLKIPKVIVEKAKAHLAAWKNSQLTGDLKPMDKQPFTTKWEKPTAANLPGSRIYSMKEAEAIAVREALSWIKGQGFSHCEVKTDALQLGSMLCLATAHHPADAKDTETTVVQSLASTLAHSVVGRE
nr:uncharacterized protein LOC109189506 [Ipomoea batatas]